LDAARDPQIDIILAGDPQLAKEILYDMRQAENAERAADERAMVAAAAAATEGGTTSAEVARRLSGSRTPGSGQRGSGGGRAPDLRQEALRRSLQLPRSGGSSGRSPFLEPPRLALYDRITQFSRSL
jgi:hypothetical protein